jgi:5-oxoprolinase (ATP-hydrolysing)
MNEDLVDLLCRNSREPDWYRSDLTAIVAATKTAGGRVCELIERFGVELYKASCDELLSRNRVAMKKIIDSTFTSEVGTFTDMVDDDGHGVGPWAITCSLHRTDEGKLRWDWSGELSTDPSQHRFLIIPGTSPQSDHSINYYFSEVMFSKSQPLSITL